MKATCSADIIVVARLASQGIGICVACDSIMGSLPCRSGSASNAACKDELEAQQQWLGYREAKAAESSIRCCLAQVR